MYRKSMAANAGMLFIYPASQAVSFWMKKHADPARHAVPEARWQHLPISPITRCPLDETPIDSGAAVNAVLEVNGGTAAALGIKEGDRVEYQTHPAQ